jgi:methyl coenzyme M reductase subunit D
MRQRYLELKDLNVHLLRQLEVGQQELDALNTKKDNLEDVSDVCDTYFPVTPSL